MTTYLLDADVIIGYLRRRLETVDLLKQLARGGNELAIATITIVEIRQGMHPDEEERTNTFLNGLKVHDLEARIARLTGDTLRDYRKRNVILSIPDAIVAATAIVNHLILVTYNSAHYPMPEVRLHPIL